MFLTGLIVSSLVDVIKTRMQAQPDVYDKGVGHAAVNILKSDGPKVLLAGLGPTVVGYGLEGGAKFGVYEVLKPVFASVFKDNTALAYIAASVVAGAVASILLCPMESTRIRIVTDPEYADRGLLTGLPKLISEEGLWSAFGSGMNAMLSKQVPYTMAKQVSFDIFAGLLYGLFQKNETSFGADDIKWIVSVTAAFIASIFACIFSQPGDMILTETYKEKTEQGFLGVVQSIYDKGGLQGFFTGTGARILHVSSIITSQLVIYDIVKQLLGLPATGSH